MKSKMILGVVAMVSSLAFSGCAVKTGNETLGKMDKTQLDRGIAKGKSTKDDVKAMLGDPDKTDFDNNGNEKWSYIHVRKDIKAVNFIPLVSLFVQGTNDTTKTLVVLFDDKGYVKNYIASDAHGETKGGLFQ